MDDTEDRPEVSEELKALAFAVAQTYDTPGWKVVEGVLRKHIEALREQNERVMGNDERHFLLGQLWSLRYVVDLPRHVAEKIEEFKKAAQLARQPALGYLEE